MVLLNVNDRMHVIERSSYCILMHSSNVAIASVFYYLNLLPIYTNIDLCVATRLVATRLNARSPTDDAPFALTLDPISHTLLARLQSGAKASWT